MGYAEHLDKGSEPDVFGPVTILGRGYDLAYLWRIQPRLTYTTQKGLSFTGEAEYTCAGYDEPVGNLRLSLSAVYAF